MRHPQIALELTVAMSAVDGRSTFRLQGPQGQDFPDEGEPAERQQPRQDYRRRQDAPPERRPQQQGGRDGVQRQDGGRQGPPADEAPRNIDDIDDDIPF